MLLFIGASSGMLPALAVLNCCRRWALAIALMMALSIRGRAPDPASRLAKLVDRTVRRFRPDAELGHKPGEIVGKKQNSRGKASKVLVAG